MSGNRGSVCRAILICALVGLVGLAGSGSTDAAVGAQSGGPPSVDCAISLNLCPSLTVTGDMPAPGGFHGYADPSMRKDPNAATIYLAYSWARRLADATHVVDLHLAHSSDGGNTWQYAGPLFTTQPFANPGGGGYALLNQTSTEVIDLLPINQNGATLWVQAHMAYLVPAGSTNNYAQLQTTNYLSLSAISLPNPGGDPTALLGLGAAKEARLGNVNTDPTLHPDVNLSALDPAVARCGHIDQPTLYAVGDTLYLAAQCFATGAGPTGANLGFAVFSTHLTGTDPTQWAWSYVGTMATAAQAQQLGTVEGVPYQFFTEMQLTTSASGQMLAILTPTIYTPTGQQPATQYGCRAIPVTSLSVPALQTDGAGVPVVVAKVTESDLYAFPNEGPATCTYEPQSSTGIVIVRKLENDPALGFFASLQSSKIPPASVPTPPPLPQPVAHQPVEGDGQPPPQPLPHPTAVLASAIPLPQPLRH